MIKINKIYHAKGEINVPGDKSISHRGIMFGALGDGISEISGFLNGADCLSTIYCFRQMGIKIEQKNTNIKIFGNGLHGLREPEKILYTGNSGTTTRLLCGLLAGQNFNSKITGDSSVIKRPLRRVTEPLTLMGAEFNGVYCPVSIVGRKLHGINYKMKYDSAQVKTALILAGLYANGETVIEEKMHSRNHTELMLKAMETDIDVEGKYIKISPKERLKPQKFEVPGDISSAAFFIVLAVIMPNSELVIHNVGINETRTGILEILKKMGADIKFENTHKVSGEMICDIIVKNSNLNGTTVEGDIIPELIDEIPILAVAAAFARGETVIKDAEELKIKETNRIKAIVQEFTKCGIDIIETEDGMIINGGKTIRGASFKTYGDHRMAMSLSILAQLAEGESWIDDEDCISVSYPKFFEDLYKLGK